MTQLRIILVAGSMLVLGACSYQDMVNLVISEAEVEFAEGFLGKVRNREYDSVIQCLDSSLVDEVSTEKLNAIASYFPPGELESVETASASLRYETGQKQIHLTLEYRFSGGWAVAQLVLGKDDDKLSVLGFHIYRTEESLKASHELGMAGKSPRHYVMLIAAIVVPIFILVSLVSCIRTPIHKRKWLWIVFVSLGFVTNRIDWHTGEGVFQPISLQLLGVGLSSAGPFAPWIVGVSFPLGAVVFWAVRKKLLKKAEVSSSEETERGLSDQGAIED